LHIDVNPVKHSIILRENKKSARRETKNMASKVESARKKQLGRNKMLNSELPTRGIKSKSGLTDEGEQLLNEAAGRLNLSARSYIKTLKVSRTIADLDGAENVGTAQVSEALQYRSKPIIL
jgi:magnesium chelatase family protein